MKKRILAVLLATAMVASLAVGCGKSNDTTKTETKTENTKTPTTETTSKTQKKEPVTVHLRWQLTICRTV